MSTPVFHRRRAERFAQLLDEPSGGLERPRTRVDDDLAKLADLGRQLSAIRLTAEVDPGYRADVRAMLMAAAEREGIGTTAKAGPATVDAPASRRSDLSAKRTGRRGRTRSLIIVGVAAGAITVSGISAATENSLPGDALYGMKRSTEEAQLRLASGDARAARHLEIAAERLSEAHAMRGQPAQVAMLLQDMDVSTRKGVRLITEAVVQRKQAAPLDRLTPFLTEQRRQLAALLDTIEGAEHARATESLRLLDSITARAEALRAALDCGADLAVDEDALGPVPDRCASGP